MTRDMAIQTAANWWADKLRKKDCIDPKIYSIKKKQGRVISEDQLAMFALELEVEIRNRIENGTDVWLSTTYAPNESLGNAANKAGINWLHFPTYINVVIINTGGEHYTVSEKSCYHDFREVKEI